MQTIIRITLISILFLPALYSNSQSDTAWRSSKEEANEYLKSIKVLSRSQYWPNVEPDLFLENLKTFIAAPLKFEEGKSTNFCGYSAITLVSLYYDPVGFCRFMIDLYENGQAKMGIVNFRPGLNIRLEAGLLKYKGLLDVSPVGQMWFLCLADHFKGYLNFFNRSFDKGDENTLWASTNFAKFNRILRKLFPIKVQAKGSDLLRPWITDIPGFLQEKIRTDLVFLYLNNRLLYRKNNAKVRFGIPTHYVQLLDIHSSGNDKLTIVYSGYGSKTLQEINPRLLKKIVFGITWFKIPEK
jgi:hypothetical protein